MPIRSTRVAAITTGTTQDITISGIGTPKAVMLVATLAVTDNTAIDGAMLSVGFWDGTRACVFGLSSEHGASSSDVYVFGASSQLVRITNPADGTTDGSVNSASWITDGIRLTWNDLPSTAVLLTVTFWYGDDIANAYVNSGLSSNSVGGTVTFTPNFQVANGIFATVKVQSHSIGFLDYDGSTIVQRGVYHADRDNQPTMALTHRVSESYILSKSNASGGILWDGEITSVTSTDFVLTTRTGADSATVGFLVWNYSGAVPHEVYTFDTPTATGNNTDANPNFQPIAQFYGMSLVESVSSTPDSSSLAGSYGISVITANEQYSNTITEEDNAADSNTQSLVDDQAVNFPLHDGSAGLAATYVSMQSTGTQLNWSDIETNAKKWIGLAIGSAPTGTDITDTQPVYLKGQSTSSDTQPIYLKGQSTASDTQTIYLHGVIISVDTQPIYLVGQSTLLDNQPVYLSGKDTLADTQPIYLFATAGATDTQPIYLVGQDSSTDTQPIYLVGQASITDTQPIFLQGYATALDTQIIYLSGKDTLADTQTIYLLGSIDVIDTQPIYLNAVSAGGEISDTQPIYLKGKADLADTQPVYTKGQDSITDTQVIYLSGRDTVTDSQPVYLRAVTWPFYEPFTGNNGDPWSNLRWYDEVSTNSTIDIQGNEGRILNNDDTAISHIRAGVDLQKDYYIEFTTRMEYLATTGTPWIFGIVKVLGEFTDNLPYTGVGIGIYYDIELGEVRYARMQRQNGSHIGSSNVLLEGVGFTDEITVKAWTYGDYSYAIIESGTSSWYFKQSLAGTLDAVVGGVAITTFPDFIDNSVTHFIDNVYILYSLAPATLPVYLKGRADQADTQPIYLKGVSTITDTQTIYLSAQDTLVDTQTIYLKGQATLTDSQPVYLVGGTAVTDSQPIYLNASGNAITDTQAVYLKGTADIADAQAIYLLASITVTDNQPIYLKGVSTLTDNQSIYLLGSINVIDSQPIYLFASGNAVADTQSIYLKGVDTILDTQSIYTKGSDNAVDSESIYLSGVAGILNNQPIYLKGQSSLTNTQSIYLIGKIDVTDNQPIYLHSEATLTDNIPIFLSSYSILSDSQSIYLSATSGITDTLPLFLQGRDVILDNQPIYVRGALTLSDTLPIYLTALYASTGTQNIYLRGWSGLTILIKKDYLTGQRNLINYLIGQRELIEEVEGLRELMDTLIGEV